MRRLILVVLLLLAVVAFSTPAAADFAAYSGTVDFRQTRGEVSVRHQHDWSKASRDVDVFDPKANEFSWILVEVDWREDFVRLPSPALDHVWASDDGKWIVGLSNLMYLNPVQLVVWERETEAVVAQVRVAPGGTIVPGHQISVTNRADWFDEKDPGIELHVEGGTPVAISVNGNEGRLKLRLSDGKLLEPADWKPAG